ncbi:hypothetical protein RH858_15860 [Halalkaliarchaeum sp. AArc-GB]|uniref:hypothetical protein n=1 Tax=Halalkaliarchaeum sp. AArc-GB TaxID=3074078 RepID=UPI0028590963|nr:hypothetical protein [Halalkaliarchaeum sp. AArc-GB]MDR5674602.1 hypothetical protein [Halalkaliarchaeum sp. AArc-GB]
MDETIATHLAEIVELVVATIGAGVISAVGIYLESLALGALSGGQFEVAVWLFAAGLVALYFGVYALGLSEVIPRLRQLRRSLAQP